MSLDDQLAALATMSLAQLRGEWLQQYKAAAPEAVGRPLLMLGIAHRLQEKAYGKLALTIVRELERLGQRLAETGSLGEEPTARLKLGTRLVREWQGRSHQVELTEKGYLYDDRTYASLSQVARTITGAQWSGPRFFGLKRAGAAGRDAARG
jgi:hypothetical protein